MSANKQLTKEEVRVQTLDAVRSPILSRCRVLDLLHRRRRRRLLHRDRRRRCRGLPRRRRRTLGVDAGGERGRADEQSRKQLHTRNRIS